MTRTSIGEYPEAVLWRYLRSSKKDKGKILDEFTKVTGYHGKTVIRLRHRHNQPSANKKRGRPRQYRATVVGALRLATVVVLGGRYWRGFRRGNGHWQESREGGG